MGQRGRAASFMPDKVVFPGGSLDPSDTTHTIAAPFRPSCAQRLTLRTDAPETAQGLGVAAIRETREETGLRLGGDGAPDLSILRFFFRAVTPPGLPKRFDARFFLATANHVSGNLDDFAGADGELSHLQWIDLDKTATMPLPFITNVVIGEVKAWIERGADWDEDRAVPFFTHDETGSRFEPL